MTTNRRLIPSKIRLETPERLSKIQVPVSGMGRAYMAG